jgi:UDP-glucose 4-epimerase
VLRLTNTIGPRMRVRDTRQTFLGIWLKSVIADVPFEVWGGDQLRDFTFVEDAVDALLLAAASEEANGRIYNLGGDCVITLKDLAETLVRANGGGCYSVREFPADRKRIDIGDYYADYSLIKSSLGWKPRVPLIEALRQTLAFYRQNFSHYV